MLSSSDLLESPAVGFRSTFDEDEIEGLQYSGMHICELLQPID
jgi:hypothetical protein